jgi:AraC-like DNA-binding protein
MRVRSSQFFRMDYGGHWGVGIDLNVDVDALVQLRRQNQPSAVRRHQPGVLKSAFHIVSAGSCWLEAQGWPGRTELKAGDFVILPRADRHVLRDTPDGGYRSLIEVFQNNPLAPNGSLRSGETGPYTRLICGGVQFDNVRTNPLLGALPPLIHVKGGDEGGARWLHLTVQHVIEELDSKHLGIQPVVGRLADILFIGAVRSHIEQSLVSAETGWFAALRDPQIGRSIALLHRDPSNPWTVDSLAETVGLSRSAFASKFTHLVGEPPLRYLTNVRLDAAAKRLRTTNDKLLAVAAGAGYDSPAAFTRAFERRLGVSPGEYRRKYLT